MSKHIIFENEIKSILEAAGNLYDAIDQDHEEFIDPRSEYQEIHHILENVKSRAGKVKNERRCNEFRLGDN